MKAFHPASLAPVALLLAACGSQPVAPAAPAALVPAGEKFVETLAARGVQIYQCRAAAGGPAWAFVAPEAELFDAQGRPAGKHYAGPHWESTDGSKILGSLKARTDATVPGAVPWLLLATKSDGGAGDFANVTSVQRLNTAGGAAPADGCSASTIGATARVPYVADYVLFAAVSPR